MPGHWAGPLLVVAALVLASMCGADPLRRLLVRCVGGGPFSGLCSPRMHIFLPPLFAPEHACAVLHIGTSRASWASTCAVTPSRACKLTFGLTHRQQRPTHLALHNPPPPLSPSTMCHRTPPRSWVTDDKGVLCQRKQLDHKTRCCSEGTTHACDG